jgi:hypothetical protein
MVRMKEKDNQLIRLMEKNKELNRINTVKLMEKNKELNRN